MINSLKIIRENMDSITVKAFFSLFDDLEAKYKDVMVMADREEVAAIQAKIRFLRDVKATITRSTGNQPSHEQDGAYI